MMWFYEDVTALTPCWALSQETLNCLYESIALLILFCGTVRPYNVKWGHSNYLWSAVLFLHLLSHDASNDVQSIMACNPTCASFLLWLCPFNSLYMVYARLYALRFRDAVECIYHITLVTDWRKTSYCHITWLIAYMLYSHRMQPC
jgi:hypothetical protein